MLEDRAFFSLVTVNNCLYAIGGLTSTYKDENNHISRLTSSVEIYDPLNNSWSLGISLPFDLCCHATTTLDNRIYVMGGVQNSFTLSTQRLSDISRGMYLQGCTTNLCLEVTSGVSWEGRSPLPVGRAGHGICQLPGNQIVLVGGLGLTERNMERYDPYHDTWDMLADSAFPTKIEWLSVTSVSNTIYIIGGGDTPPAPGCLTPKFGHLFTYQCGVKSEPWNMQLTSWEQRFLPGSQLCASKLPKDLPDVKASQKQLNGFLGPLRCIKNQEPPQCRLEFREYETESDANKTEDQQSITVEAIQKELAVDTLEKIGKYCESCFSDVVLIADGISFSSSKALLSACSDYFKAMFTGGLRESTFHQQKVELVDITADALTCILHYVYTGTLILTHENVISVLDAASHFQMVCVQKLCIRYLQEFTSVETFTESFNIAMVYSLQGELLQSSKIMDIFMSLAKDQSSSLVDISYEGLTCILTQPSMALYSPEDVFKIIVEWIRQDENHAKKAEELMSYVKLTHMETSRLVDVVQQVPYMTERSSLRSLIVDALKSHHTAIDHQETNEGSEDVVIAIEGLNLNHQSHMYYLDGENNQWRKLSRLPANQLAFSVAVFNNVLYLAGGEVHQSLDVDRSGTSFAVDTVYRYDPRNNQWMVMAPMRTKRTDFCLLACKGYLYAVCGRNTSSKYGMRDVERYDPKLNVWAASERLPEPMYAMGGAEFDGKIYINGGHAGSLYSSSNKVYCYNPDTKQWLQKSSSVIHRSWHNIVTMANYLYALGGLQSGRNRNLWRLERYDPKADSWIVLDHINQQIQSPIGSNGTIAGYKCTILNGQLYVIYGHFLNGDYIVGRVVFRYDMQQNKWQKCPDLVNEDCQALCTLKVSKHLIHADRECETEMPIAGDGDGQPFTDRKHCLQTLHGLYALQQEELLCDTTLRIGKRVFHCLGVMLTAASSVFEQLIMQGKQALTLGDEQSQDTSVIIQKSARADHRMFEVYGVTESDFAELLQLACTMQITVQTEEKFGTIKKLAEDFRLKFTEKLFDAYLEEMRSGADKTEPCAVQLPGSISSVKYSMDEIADIWDAH
ncbi:kelch-like protein 31 [Ptychodera flava]|uniref:kelch-like protein 31 n=1 Tax=Ptychodera flava TaxID=63121 RepID=UPI003969DC97